MSLFSGRNNLSEAQTLARRAYREGIGARNARQDPATLARGLFTGDPNTAPDIAALHVGWEMVSWPEVRLVAEAILAVDRVLDRVDPVQLKVKRMRASDRLGVPRILETIDGAAPIEDRPAPEYLQKTQAQALHGIAFLLAEDTLNADLYHHTGNLFFHESPRPGPWGSDACNLLALACFAIAGKLRPSHSAAHTGMFQVLDLITAEDELLGGLAGTGLRLLVEGNRLLRGERYVEAHDRLVKFIDHADSPYAWLAYQREAEVLEHLGDRDQAQGALILTLNILLNGKDYEGAQNAARWLIELNPEGRFYEALGFACYHSGAMAEALQAYTEAIELDGSQAKAYWGRGLTLRELGEEQQAEQMFRQAKAFGMTFDD